MLTVSFYYEGDTEGCESCCSHKTGNTYYPCRICWLERHSLMSTQIDSIPRRDSTDAIPTLKKAFAAFCRFSRKEIQTEDDKEVLLFCQEKSLQPILPSFFKLEIPYAGFSHYIRFQFDLLHTNTGVLKKFVALTLLCIKKVSGLPKYKNRGGLFTIAKLDAMIKAFPFNMHSMPCYMKHLTEGVSCYCLSWLSGAGEKTGYGDLKIIDSKDVPSLILQMLLCTYHLQQNNIF